MNLLITGGDGVLARAIMIALPANVAVRAVDTRWSAPLPDAVNAVEQRTGDLRDAATVTALLDGMDAVLHVAPLSTRFADDLTTLDHATRGTYHLATLAPAAGVSRLVLLSTLDLFARCPATWRVDENWRPRPTSRLADLCAWLPEITARELARDTDLHTICVRVGPYMNDAVTALLDALQDDGSGWSVLHAGRRGAAPPDDPTALWPAALASPEPIAARPIRNVLLLGAGGPLAAAAARELAAHYTLRLADLRPLAELAAGSPQSPGAPLPVPLDPPHECRVVDVCDFAQVRAACAGMDAIINCTVVRRDPVEAFRVNVLGAYNVMRAAVAHGIQRVVHTGPYQVAPLGPTSYLWDAGVPDDAPPRPGFNHMWQLYFHTKLLGQELCRAFADYHDLQVPVLLFCEFVQPDRPRDGHLYPFAVSWQDAARALHRALEAELPSSYEVLHITADLPPGIFPNRKARQILGWQPQDDLRAWWSDV